MKHAKHSHMHYFMVGTGVMALFLLVVGTSLAQFNTNDIGRNFRQNQEGNNFGGQDQRGGMMMDQNFGGNEMMGQGFGGDMGRNMERNGPQQMGPGFGGGGMQQGRMMPSAQGTRGPMQGPQQGPGPMMGPNMQGQQGPMMPMMGGGNTQNPFQGGPINEMNLIDTLSRWEDACDSLGDNYDDEVANSISACGSMSSIAERVQSIQDEYEMAQEEIQEDMQNAQDDEDPKAMRNAMKQMQQLEKDFKKQLKAAAKEVKNISKNITKEWKTTMKNYRLRQKQEQENQRKEFENERQRDQQNFQMPGGPNMMQDPMQRRMGGNEMPSVPAVPAEAPTEIAQ